MFSGFRSNRGRGNLFGRPKKPSNSKKYYLGSWILLNKKKKKHHMDVMRSGDSPQLSQVSIPSAYDTPDEAGLPGKLTRSSSPVITSVQPLRPESTEKDAEEISIDEVVPKVDETLTTPEPYPRIEKNGYDHKYTDEKKLVDNLDDDPCIVKCIYFTQQCCECTIM